MRQRLPNISDQELNLLFERISDNGGPFWSRGDGDIHAPAGFSTIDVLYVLGDVGLTPSIDDRLIDLVAFLFEYQNSDGSFRYNSKSTKLPCMAGRIAAGLGRVGAETDTRLETTYKWFLDTQMRDGGWRCNTVKVGRSKLTDASNPGTTLYILDALRFTQYPTQHPIALNRAVEFLLRHWETRLPLGPCDFGIGSRFIRTEYPTIRYNLLYYVYALSFYEYAQKDARFIHALDLLANDVKNDMLNVYQPHHRWRDFSFAIPGEISTLGTKLWFEIIENMRSAES